MPFLPPNQQRQSTEGNSQFIACLRNPWIASIWNKNFKALESAWKQITCLKVLENPWKVREFKSWKFWNFVFVDNFEASTCMHVTGTWKQYLISLCLLAYLIKILTVRYHYGIGECSTVHFSVTLQSKFWLSASRIWLFVDNFGAWKMQFGSLKGLEKCFNFVLWVCYEPCSIHMSVHLHVSNATSSFTAFLCLCHPSYGRSGALFLTCLSVSACIHLCIRWCLARTVFQLACHHFHCFDAVGWAAGRASGL